MNATPTEIIAAVFFALAIVHTFTVKQFQHWALKFPEGSVGENLFHLLGEVEIVFGLWSGALLFFITSESGGNEAIAYLENLNFTEPGFVFVIMAIASTKPVVTFAESAIAMFAEVLPIAKRLRFYCATLTLGPILGSLITEPAAMTVTALVLKKYFYSQKVSTKFQYFTLGTLFVNVSIGGVLTHFAAPPVLMVARVWNWDLAHMFTHFGWKAVVAVCINTAIAVMIFGKELRVAPKREKGASIPKWIILTHLAALVLVVATAHHMVVFMGIFIFFLGIVTITKEYQHEVRLRESFLVGFFLGGLVVLGSLQRWWLEPLLAAASELPLFIGTTILTAFNDNAALAYLGSQVPGLSDTMKYALIAGAVAGGGLTVIANAPNPAGYSLLSSEFGEEGISPLHLFLGSLIPTLVAMIALWFLPSLA